MMFDCLRIFLGVILPVWFSMVLGGVVGLCRGREWLGAGIGLISGGLLTAGFHYVF